MQWDPKELIVDTPVFKMTGFENLMLINGAKFVYAWCYMLKDGSWQQFSLFRPVS